MKQSVEKRKSSGIVDYIALALTTWGVGYGPIAPGTWGSLVGVGIYLAVESLALAFLQSDFGVHHHTSVNYAIINAVVASLLISFSLIGIWASGRSIPMLGSKDPSEAVVDEVVGQLITFCFIPFGLHWPYILAGFLLFRLFDIIKPFPARTLEMLPGGLGICADDIMAGVYAGICLAVGYAIYLAI